MPAWGNLVPREHDELERNNLGEEDDIVDQLCPPGFDSGDEPSGHRAEEKDEDGGEDGDKERVSDGIPEFGCHESVFKVFPSDKGFGSREFQRLTGNRTIGFKGV